MFINNDKEIIQRRLVFSFYKASIFQHSTKQQYLQNKHKGSHYYFLTWVSIKQIAHNSHLWSTHIKLHAMNVIPLSLLCYILTSV